MIHFDKTFIEVQMNMDFVFVIKNLGLTVINHEQLFKNIPSHYIVVIINLTDDNLIMVIEEVVN